MGLGNISEEDSAAMMKDADKDGDGAIDFGEFRAMCLQRVTKGARATLEPNATMLVRLVVHHVWDVDILNECFKVDISVNLQWKSPCQVRC